VALERYTHARYRPAEVLATLPPALARSTPDNRPRTGDLRRAYDPLLGIAPAHYVRVLTGREPGPDGKIICPLHTEKTPSLHVYATAERGWACFGCRARDGKPLGGDIYTLASQLWGVPARGRDFLALRSGLDALFGVERG
jgi:hypothetical protein